MFLLLAASCATYQPQPLSVRDNATALTTRNLESETVRSLIIEQHPDLATPWPPSKWSAEMLALAAVAVHPDLDVACAELAQARAALLTAKARPNPSLNGGVERKSGSSGLNPWIATLALDVPIETNGKRDARIAEAQALTTAAAADVDQAVWTVRTRAANALVDLAASQSIAASRAKETALREEIVAMLERRVAVGEAAQPELTRSRSEASIARQQQRDTTARIEETTSVVATSIGIAPPALPSIDFDPLNKPPTSIEDDQHMREIALTARPDVLAALARYAAAEEALRLEIRKQFPDIHFGPGIGWDQGAFKWSATIAADLPIFNRNEGPIAEAQSRRATEGARVFALQSQILGDLETALAMERGARARLDDAEHVLASRRAEAVVARRQFNAGEIDRLALRSIEVEEATAESERWSALFAVRRARVAVEAAVEQPMGALQ